jgi:hypothetical protein
MACADIRAEFIQPAQLVLSEWRRGWPDTNLHELGSVLDVTCSSSLSTG